MVNGIDVLFSLKSITKAIFMPNKGIKIIREGKMHKLDARNNFFVEGDHVQGPREVPNKGGEGIHPQTMR